MAKRKQAFELPLSTIIEVIAKKDDQVIKKEMTLQEYKEIKKRKGWQYSSYKLGHSQYKLTKD